jgi:outer membrane protein assembly factor BamB
MNEDFVTRLGVALREAADRREQRGAPARAAAAVQATLPRVRYGAALAALAAAAVIAVAVLAATALRPAPEAPNAPQVVTRLAPGGSGDELLPAFGSAWLIDRTGERVLRIDPSTRRTTARIAVPGIVAADPGGGALWVTQTTPTSLLVLELDPASNRVVTRMRVPGRGGRHDFGFPLAVGGGVWIVGGDGVVRLDPRTHQVTSAVDLSRHGYLVRDCAVFDGDLWALVSDGTVHRLDGRTGATKAVLRIPVVGGLIPVAGGLLLVDNAHLALMDPATGRLRWRTAVPQVGALAPSDGRIWAETPGRGGDRVVALDPRTGRTVASVHVGEFTATWMARVGPELWMTTAGGKIVILRP